MACTLHPPLYPNHDCDPLPPSQTIIIGKVIEFERIDIPAEPSDHNLGFIRVQIDTDAPKEFVPEPIKVVFRYTHKIWEQLEFAKKEDKAVEITSWE